MTTINLLPQLPEPFTVPVPDYYSSIKLYTAQQMRSYATEAITAHGAEIVRLQQINLQLVNKCNSYIIDNARKDEELIRLRSELALELYWKNR